MSRCERESIHYDYSQNDTVFHTFSFNDAMSLLYVSAFVEIPLDIITGKNSIGTIIDEEHALESYLDDMSMNQAYIHFKIQVHSQNGEKIEIDRIKPFLFPTYTETYDGEIITLSTHVTHCIRNLEMFNEPLLVFYVRNILDEDGKSLLFHPDDRKKISCNISMWYKTSFYP